MMLPYFQPDTGWRKREGKGDMDMHSRREYLRELVMDYSKGTKAEKGKLLDEYVRNTGHNRKYVITRLNDPNLLTPVRLKRKHPSIYGLSVEKPLQTVWEIFDYPCGQRLKPMLVRELDRLRTFGEILISPEVAQKLERISPATIDRHLRRAKVGEHRRRFCTTKPGSLLKARIPVRLTDWNTQEVGYVEADLVAHNGGNPAGEFGNTLSITEIGSGWWEGEAIGGKGEMGTLGGIKNIRERTPFTWQGLDSDNGGEFINGHLMRYCIDEKLKFTRGRPSRKNDNAYVEQKNWTHVRKIFGYLRYDTQKEIAAINDLYRNELRLYKNFFQPVMKLKSKERIGAHVKRRYEVAKTPHERLMESKQISKGVKQQLKDIHARLNPAALKREIDRKLWRLQQIYEAKQRNRKSKGKGISTPKNIHERRIAYG